MSLGLMRDKGVISQAEYDSALRDLSETTGLRTSREGTVVLGKWATTLYGYVEGDAISDSTRSFTDSAGNAQVARAGTPNGDNYRFTMATRDSRIGLRMLAPEMASVRTSAMLEMDFLGTQLPVGSAQPYQGTEAAYFTNPTFRVRHMNFKLETPVVDVLFGQYWQLFGWEGGFRPNTVQIQGVPGELNSRTPELLISKAFRGKLATFEVAVAATRPAQRDSGVPDGEGGVRLAVDTWTGIQTTGATGTRLVPLSVALTGLVRRVEVDAFSASPKTTVERVMNALAIDGFLPVVPVTMHKKDNSLSINGEFATGYGFADLYTGLTGGISFPALPTAGQTYTPDIDNGIVTFDSRGGLHGIQWTSYLVGAQYFLPGVDGRLWISGNYSHIESANSHFYGDPTKTTAAEDWFDVNLFVDPMDALRFGLEYSNFNTMYVDGVHAINHRVQLSGFFIF
jgi:hypothetical protein